MKGWEDDVYVQTPEKPEYVDYVDEDDKQEDMSESLPLGQFGEADIKYAKQDIDFVTVGDKNYIKDSKRYDIRSLNMVDVKDIDVVLVSNYTSVCALPFICCHPEFKGMVFITEPLQQIGKFLCAELVEMHNKGKYLCI